MRANARLLERPAGLARDEGALRMNDIAQLGLRTAGAAVRRVRAQVRRQPFVALAAGGFLASTLIVVAGGRVGGQRLTIPLTTWLGLLSREGARSGDYLPGAVMLAGIALLIGLWLVAVAITGRTRAREPHIWLMAGAWSLPLVIGPPLLSSDVYTYAAQGLMVRHGIDPYTHGPAVLGTVRAVQAVDPTWRSEPSPYGPLATTVQHLAIAISGGSPLGAVLMFRALAVLSTVAIGLLAAELSGGRRVRALTLTVMNPLVLLHVVSAAHFEGVMVALLLGSLVAVTQRRWALAILLACASGSIKAPAFIAVLAIIALHAAATTYGAARLRVAARDIGVALVGVAGLSLLVPNGLGWVRALDTPTLGHTPFAPASLIADMFAPIVQGASYDDRAAGGRITALLAAGCIVVYLIATVRRRPLEQTVGYGLIAIGLLGPVLYPWYLLWGIVCLLPTAKSAATRVLVLASGLACVFVPPGFTKGLSNTITVTAFLAAVAGAAVWASGPHGDDKAQVAEAREVSPAG